MNINLLNNCHGNHLDFYTESGNLYKADFQNNTICDIKTGMTMGITRCELTDNNRLSFDTDKGKIMATSPITRIDGDVYINLMTKNGHQYKVDLSSKTVTGGVLNNGDLQFDYFSKDVLGRYEFYDRNNTLLMSTSPVQNDYYEFKPADYSLNYNYGINENIYERD